MLKTDSGSYSLTGLMRWEDLMPTLKVRHVLTKDSSLVLQNDQLRREIQTLNNQTLIQYPLRVLRLTGIFPWEIGS